MDIHGLFPKPIGFKKLDRDFTKDEISICEKIKNNSMPNNGNRTSNDRYVLETEGFEGLKSFIDESVDEYFNTIFSPKTDVRLVVTQSWLNFTDKDEFHHVHSHNNSFISGVFYINTTKNDMIKFYLNQWEPFDIHATEYNYFNSTSWYYPAEQNQLILFPSSLTHGVDTVKDENHTRISLSFNTFLKGTIGSSVRATELII